MKRQTITALLITLPLWIGFSSPHFTASASAGTSQIHDAPLDEALDFYQFTDNEGVIHFVDSPEKIPAHYRSRAVVRKELPSARQTTRVAIVDNTIHVPVLFKNGSRKEKAVLILDTGAAFTCINEEIATRLAIDLAAARKSTMRLADGSMVDVRLAKIDSVSVGFREKSPLEICILRYVGTREIHDGLLGFDFLGDFQYQVDVPSRMIRWQ